MKTRTVLTVCLLLLMAAPSGCGDNERGGVPVVREVGGILSFTGRVLGGSQPEKTDRRPVSAEPANATVGAPSVKDFLAVCDLMARDLVMTGVVQTATQPVVVELRPMENKTDAKIDLTIYPQTIRGIILKSGANRIAFRDETARRDILAERSHQTDDPVSVDYEATTDTTRTVANTSAPTAKSESEAGKMKVKKSTEVSSRIAATDYFLNGFIYATTEGSANSKSKPYRYFRFQFRLTDARSGLVVWENDYEVKKQGDAKT